MTQAKPPIDIHPYHWLIVRDILRKQVPQYSVWAFGSRATWKAKTFSDLDLAVMTNKPLSLEVIAELGEAFSESDLPWKVDIIDWSAISEDFRKVIARDKVIVQEPQDGSRKLTMLPLEACLDALIDYRGKTPRKVGKGIPLITAKVVKGGRIEPPGEFIAEEDYKTWMSRGYPAVGDVVLTTEAPLGEVAQIKYLPVALAQRIITLRGKPDVLTSDYLLYLLQSDEMQTKLLGRSTGTTVVGIKQSELRKIELALPPISEQRAIAHILGTLDDKIELNRRRNQTLEAMARALFKDWFVDFGPVRAKMEGREPYLPADLWQLFPDRLDDKVKPEGWEKRPIYEFSNVVYGAPFASKQFNTAGSGLPLIRIRDLASHEPGVWTEQVHPKGHLIEPGDIVVGMDGEFRLHIWKGQPAWLNQRVCHFEPLRGVPSSFLVGALAEPLAFFERGKVGTTVIHLGKGDIDTFRLLHPGDKLLHAFAHAAEPWVAETVRNALESRTLAQLRDTLLPKLISGELRIPDAKKHAEGVRA